MAKKPFNTKIEEDIVNAFSQRCKENGEKVTDVAEALFSLYVDGKIRLERRITYDIKTEKNGSADA